MIPASSSRARGECAEPVGPGLDVTAGRGRLLGEDLLRQHLAEHRVHPAHRVAHAHAPERVAVVAAAHGQHPGPLGAPEAALVLEHHLERDLDAHRAGVGEEDVLEPVRRELDQPLGQPDRGGVGQPAEHHVRHLAEPGRRARRPARARRTRGSPPTTTTSRRRARCRRPSRSRTPDARLDQPHRRRLGHRGVGVPDVLAVVREQLVGGAVMRWGRRRCPRRGGAWPGRAWPRRARRRRRLGARAPRSRCRGSARGRPRRPGPRR